VDNLESMDSLRESWRTLRRAMPDVRQDSYSVEGLAHLLGIPREVINHEICTGELRAVRHQHRTICIDRSEVLDWLRRRGPGV